MKKTTQNATQIEKKRYPSDITRKAFSKIAPLLGGVRKKTKPRKLDLYDIFCGVLYILKSGASWRMLPNDYPKWGTCYAYFQKWTEIPEGHRKSALDKAMSKLVREARKKEGRSSRPSLAIVAAQSVKNTDTANAKGYDGGNK
ncbi:MAG: transposase, partial [Bacteroidota bacterium]